jgi:N-acetylglucosaminyl-diphospho-decaprenol L-rhamnosyltransferase
MKKGLDLIIINWNSGGHLRECISSIASSQRSDFKLNSLILIDNASTDNSLGLVNCNNLPLKIIRNPVNIGFAKACNQGAKYGSSEFILFLNPDTRLYNNSLSEPIVFMKREDNKTIGIVGIQIVNEKEEVVRSFVKFPTFWMFIVKILGLHHLFPKGLFPIYYMYNSNVNESKFVDQVSGAFFLVRRSLFEKLEGFDERFFVYFEDMDFSIMAKKIGYQSYFLASAKVYHRGGGTTENLKGVSLFYYLRSRILYCYKHFDLFQATILSFLTLFIEPITRTIFAVLSKSSPYSIKDIIKAYFLIWSKILSFSFTKNFDK